MDRTLALRFLDKPGCGCADCRSGRAIPVDKATDVQLLQRYHGGLRDRTGLDWPPLRESADAAVVTAMREGIARQTALRAAS